MIPAGLVTYEELEDALREMVAPPSPDTPSADESNPGAHDDVVVSTTDRRWLDRAVVVFAIVVLPAIAAIGIGQAPRQWLTILGATSMVSGILLAGAFRTHRGFTVARAETATEHKAARRSTGRRSGEEDAVHG